MELRIHKRGETEISILGSDLTAGELSQLIVPSNAWQKFVPIDV